MARLLALDIGMKRIGLAGTDPFQMIASPLKTVQANDIWTCLKQEFEAELPDALIIGMPKGLDNKATDGTKFALEFAVKFRKKYPETPLHEVDERFTSKMASQAMQMGGVKTKGNKALIDELSATIILQGYLDSIK